MAYLYISIIYLTDFLVYFPNPVEDICREILYITGTIGTRLNACAVLCLLYVNPLEKFLTPTPYMLQTIVLLLFTSSIF